MKYRKKPIIIEAYQTDVELDIQTLEGVMHASIGDYIITGINGEKYPCKPDIFEKTYELVEENNYEMSEELSPLKALKNIRTLFIGSPINLSQQLNIIETALKEHELMKQIRITARFDLAQVNKEHKALEIIKELILEDLVFDDKEQAINFSFGISTLCIKIEDKNKYDLLKEVLL